MQPDTTNLSYNEFLAFVMIYAASMDNSLTKEELSFIMQKTGASDVERIKAQVDGMADAESIELIDDYKKKYLAQPELVVKARRDLEGLLATPGQHSQLEKAVVHIIERLL